jgi:hypothetical protein
MLTTQDCTPRENTERFAKKIGSASPYSHRTHLIATIQLLYLQTYQILSAGNCFSIT